MSHTWGEASRAQSLLAPRHHRQVLDPPKDSSAVVGKVLPGKLFSILIRSAEGSASDHRHSIKVT
jgi:hypothetical protein